MRPISGRKSLFVPKFVPKFGPGKKICPSPGPKRNLVIANFFPPRDNGTSDKLGALFGHGQCPLRETKVEEAIVFAL